jgi:hypothetical protein
MLIVCHVQTTLLIVCPHLIVCPPNFDLNSLPSKLTHPPVSHTYQTITYSTSSKISRASRKQDKQQVLIVCPSSSRKMRCVLIVCPSSRNSSRKS